MRKKPISGKALFILICLVSIFSTGASRPAARVWIDPQVLAEAREGGQVDFLVLLSSQADLAPFAALDRRGDAPLRVEGVVRALRGTAAQSQVGVVSLLEKLGVEYRPYWIANAIRVRGDLAVIQALAARSDVAALAADSPHAVGLPQPETGLSPQSELDSLAVEPNIAAVRAPQLWALGFTGQGIVVAGADTGVNWQHPAMKEHYRGWNGSSADHNYSWWDAIHSDQDGQQANLCDYNSLAPCDDAGSSHGTHSLGTVVGSEGVINQIGMAPGAEWIACRNMDNGFGRPSTYIECLEFFLAPTDLNGLNPDPARHADVINNSYSCTVGEGCTLVNLHILQSTVNALRAAGIFMAVSAGNSGPTCATINSPPGLEDNVFTVGAADNSGLIAGFSSRGPVTVDGSGLRKPDLVAPGVSVRSSQGSSGYGFLSGTSMAGPHVAGAVALLWSALPDLKGNIARTELMLVGSAQPKTTTQTCGGDTPTTVPNHTYGYGLLDVYAAYQLPVYDTYMPVINRQLSFP